MDIIKHLFYIVVLFFLIGFSSCNSKKTQQSIKYKTEKDISLQALFSALDSTQNNYDFFTCRLSAHIKMDNSNNNIGGKIRAKNNEVVWISIFPTQVLELLRLKATPDSLLMVNYIEKKYFRGVYDYFSNSLKFDLDFHTLESILFGKNHTLFSRELYQNSFENGKYFIANTDYRTFDKTVSKNDGYKTALHGMWIEPSTLKLHKQIIYDPIQKRTLTVEYKSYEIIDKNFIPTKIEISLLSKETNLKSTIEFSRIDLKTEVGFPINIPNKYEEIR